MKKDKLLIFKEDGRLRVWVPNNQDAGETMTLLMAAMVSTLLLCSKENTDERLDASEAIEIAGELGRDLVRMTEDALKEEMLEAGGENKRKPAKLN